MQMVLYFAVTIAVSITQWPFRSDNPDDLKALKRSPDLLNNVKISQGQLRHSIITY